jgi:3-(3-hydroxy-phenyl)propionate hydroxylase
LIAGAGPVGLFAAIRLTGFGIPVTLVEQGASVGDDIRASTFHPPTLEMMEPYGITEEMVAAGEVVPEWQIRMHVTGEKVLFDLGRIADRTRYPFRLQYEQRNLCAVMDQMLRAEPLAELIYGTELVAAVQDGDAVAIQTRCGGEARRLHGRFLIAADGGASTVRSLLGIPFDGSIYPERTVLVTTPFPFGEHIEGLSGVSYCWHESGNFALLKLPGCWRASLYFPEDLRAEDALSDDYLQAQLSEICPTGGRFEILDKREYRVHQRIVPGYNHGRILLAGDAAHLNSPSGGMGMNGGLHDAHNLTEKLNDIWRGGDLALLDLYSRQRHPVAKNQIIEQADQNRKRMTEKSPQKRREHFAALEAIAADDDKCRAFLIRSSMIEGLEMAAGIP